MDKRLKRIEDDLYSLRSSLLTPREKEYKQRVLKYVQTAFQEFSQVDVGGKIDRMDHLSECSKRKFCKNLMRSQVEAASMAYLHGDVESSKIVLDGLHKRIDDLGPDCECEECRRHALTVISETRAVLVMAKRIEMSRALVTGSWGTSSLMSQFTSRINTDDEEAPESEEAPDQPLDLDRASDALGALSHRARLEILTKLEGGEKTFSELSKELNLRTGHLQYHLKVLEEGGFVRRNRKGGRYLITLQGATALNGLRDLMSNLVCLAPVK